MIETCKVEDCAVPPSGSGSNEPFGVPKRKVSAKHWVEDNEILTCETDSKPNGSFSFLFSHSHPFNASLFLPNNLLHRLPIDILHIFNALLFLTVPSTFFHSSFALAVPFVEGFVGSEQVVEAGEVCLVRVLEGYVAVKRRVKRASEGMNDVAQSKTRYGGFEKRETY